MSHYKFAKSAKGVIISRSIFLALSLILHSRGPQHLKDILAKNVEEDCLWIVKCVKRFLCIQGSESVLITNRCVEFLISVYCKF